MLVNGACVRVVVGMVGRRLGFASRLCAVALTAACISAAPAAAHESGPPRYSLSIVEGETTLPEYGIVTTNASVRPRAPIRISIVRGGATVFQNTGSEGDVSLQQVPQVGDVVKLETPLGTQVAAEVYDGLPTMDPTVCAGSANFSGQRSAGDTVEGGYFSVVEKSNPYYSYYERTSQGQAQITTLSGSSFGGNFLTPLLAGESVRASESLETPLEGGAVFTYSSENVRPVGACPPPPAPPPPPPPPPALQGLIAKLGPTTIRSLLRHGWSDEVAVNQPGTVTQDLYLLGGTLPAYASRAHGKHKPPPPALLLARGSANAGAAGQVTVELNLTRRGRARLRSAKRVHAVLVTTVHSAVTGARLSLPRRALTLHS